MIILDRPPKEYIRTQGATTAPLSAEWYNNGESRFSGKRHSVLVLKDLKK